jgi:hypothetical protein
MSLALDVQVGSEPGAPGARVVNAAPVIFCPIRVSRGTRAAQRASILADIQLRRPRFSPNFNGIERRNDSKGRLFETERLKVRLSALD